MPLRTVVLSWIGALCLLQVAWGETATRKPNIVFILADDVGVEPLDCYGGTPFKTPALNRLADSGMRFTHCYSMPVCHPTRVCFMTGRYPRSIGTPKWGSFPRELEHQTIAHAMKDAGYVTAVAGKWQLGLLGKDKQQPHRMGFDEYCLFGWHEGPRYHDPLIWQNGSLRQDTGGAYGPDLYVDFLADFFQRQRDVPFFAFYSMALCHDVTDDLREPVPYVPGEQRYLSYAEMVQSMDACVGRVVASLQKLDLLEHTWIVFSGDNGTASRSIVRAERENGRWKYVRESVYATLNGRRVQGGKGSLTDAGTHVPLLVSRPGSLPPGSTSDALVDFSDFLPTFTQWAGASPPTARVDGRSFADILDKDRPTTGRNWAYAEAKGRYWVRNQRFKLYSTGSFYDVASDPDERRDLSATELSDEAETQRRSLQAALRQLQ